jgi:hypothetical protein
LRRSISSDVGVANKGGGGEDGDEKARRIFLLTDYWQSALEDVVTVIAEKLRVRLHFSAVR